MNTYAEEFKNHPIHATVETILQLVGSIQKSFTTQSPEGSIALTRLEAIVRFVKGRLEAADPYLTPNNKLNELQGAASLVQQQVETVQSTGAPDELKTAVGNAESMLIHCAYLNRTQNDAEVKQLGSAAQGLRTTYEQLQRKASEEITRIENRAGEAERGLDKLDKRIEDARGNMSTALSEFQGQFSTAQDSRSQAFTASQDAHQNSHNDLIKNHNIILMNQERETTRIFGEKEKENQGKLDDLNTDFTAKAQDILTEIEKKKGEVEKLLGVIGTLGVSSGYKKAADENKEATWKWQVATVVSILLLIGFAVALFWPDKDHPFTWEGLVARIVLTFGFGVLAAYCGFQGDRSHHMERRNRKTALEFEALGAYLDPLPEAQQHEFRLKLAELSFGKEDPKFTKDDRSPASMWDLIAKDPELAQKILDMITKLKNGTK
jgi:hypothetical protein